MIMISPPLKPSVSFSNSYAKHRNADSQGGYAYQRSTSLRTNARELCAVSDAADADDGVISNEAMAATVLAVLGSLVGVYFYFFRGVNNTPEAIEVRQKKARLALAQMAQTIIMAKERKEQDARVAANGGGK